MQLTGFFHIPARHFRAGLFPRPFLAGPEGSGVQTTLNYDKLSQDKHQHSKFSIFTAQVYGSWRSVLMLTHSPRTVKNYYEIIIAMTGIIIVNTGKSHQYTRHFRLSSSKNIHTVTDRCSKYQLREPLPQRTLYQYREKCPEYHVLFHGSGAGTLVSSPDPTLSRENEKWKWEFIAFVIEGLGTRLLLFMLSNENSPVGLHLET